VFSGAIAFSSSYKIPVLMDIATSPSLQRPRTTQPHNMPCTKQRGAFRYNQDIADKGAGECSEDERAQANYCNVK
jgi:hypothetical protein